MTVNDYQSQGVMTLNTPVSYSINKLLGGSTILGGNNYTAFFINYDEKNVVQSTVQKATNATIHGVSNTNLQIVQGSGNTIYADRDLTFLNGTGKTYAEVNGASSIFCSNGLDLTLDAFGANSLIVGDKGSYMVNASKSTADISVYAYPNNDVLSSLWMFSGDGNTIFAAGTGMSVFSGSNASNNSFVFTKSSVAGGKTIILNFDHNPKNKIVMYNYSLDQNSLKEILNNAYNLNNNAIIELENHTIILAGILVKDINSAQFEYA
ncbi:hypothetical protein [Commensalibacter communis]|uniref:hypothetical protein n=1 Tax=Commensalibacter communis TaxID=2972786 RepID=UPI0022FF8A69|nr:hypothetical protein [Commensalibacter communis]CAI3959182.1 unnamed protein product [Commensalibacter communis]CAI3959210.1 unnamed protein product [Commensalibacter communis]